MGFFPSLFNYLRGSVPSEDMPEAAPAPEANLHFSGAPVVQSPKNPGTFIVQGEHYPEYEDFLLNDNDFEYVPASDSQITFIRARDIEGVELYSREYMDPGRFWVRDGRANHSEDAIMEKASHLNELKERMESGSTVNELLADPELGPTAQSYLLDPPQVNRCGDFYINPGDGRHRTIAAQRQDTYIPAVVTGEYVDMRQEADKAGTKASGETAEAGETVDITNPYRSENRESVPNRGLPAAEETVSSDMPNTNAQAQPAPAEISNTSAETSHQSNDEGMNF